MTPTTHRYHLHLASWTLETDKPRLLLMIYSQTTSLIWGISMSILALYPPLKSLLMAPSPGMMGNLFSVAALSTSDESATFGQAPSPKDLLLRAQVSTHPHNPTSLQPSLLGCPLIQHTLSIPIPRHLSLPAQAPLCSTVIRDAM